MLTRSMTRARDSTLCFFVLKSLCHLQFPSQIFHFFSNFTHWLYRKVLHFLYGKFFFLRDCQYVRAFSKTLFSFLFAVLVESILFTLSWKYLKHTTFGYVRIHIVYLHVTLYSLISVLFNCSICIFFVVFFVPICTLS